MTGKEALDYTIRIGSNTDLSIFRFVSLLCLRSTLRLLETSFLRSKRYCQLTKNETQHETNVKVFTRSKLKTNKTTSFI